MSTSDRRRGLSRLRGEVDQELPQQEGVEHEVQEGDHVRLPRVVRDPLAEAFEDPAHLGVDADEAERGVSGSGNQSGRR